MYEADSDIKGYIEWIHEEQEALPRMSIASDDDTDCTEESDSECVWEQDSDAVMGMEDDLEELHGIHLKSNPDMEHDSDDEEDEDDEEDDEQEEDKEEDVE